MHYKFFDLGPGVFAATRDRDARPTQRGGSQTPAEGGKKHQIQRQIRPHLRPPPTGRGGNPTTSLGAPFCERRSMVQKNRNDTRVNAPMTHPLDARARTHSPSPSCARSHSPSLSPRAAVTSAGGCTSATSNRSVLPRLPLLVTTVNHECYSPGSAGCPMSAGRMVSCRHSRTVTLAPARPTTSRSSFSTWSALSTVALDASNRSFSHCVDGIPAPGWRSPDRISPRRSAAIALAGKVATST